MMDDDHSHKCEEDYKSCMEARKARVTRVIGEHPGASKAEIAKIAGVTTKTVKRYRVRNRKGGGQVSPQD